MNKETTSSTSSQSKAIVFDASTLISFSMNGLLPELKELKKAFNGKFLITKEVKYEIIDKPSTIKRFQLEALKLKGLLEDKTLELPSVFEIDEKEVSKKTEEIIRMASKIFESDRGEIKIIGSGESSCFVLSKMLTKKGVKNVIAIDERTGRMLVEKPENLKELLQRKLHTKVMLKKENFDFFKGIGVIRSSELVYVAYKKGLTNLKNKDVLGSLLWAVKYKGCSISGDEIDEIKRIG